MFHASRISSSIIAVIVCSVHIRFGLVWRCTVKADVFLHMEQGFLRQLSVLEIFVLHPQCKTGRVRWRYDFPCTTFLGIAKPKLLYAQLHQEHMKYTFNPTAVTWGALSSVIKHLTQVLPVRSPANPTKNTKGRDVLILLRKMLHTSHVKEPGL